MGKDNNISIFAITLIEHNVTLTQHKQSGALQFISPQDDDELIDYGSDLLALDKTKDEQIFNSVNQILRTRKVYDKNQSKRPPPDRQNMFSNAVNMSGS